MLPQLTLSWCKMQRLQHEKVTHSIDDISLWSTDTMWFPLAFKPGTSSWLQPCTIVFRIGSLSLELLAAYDLTFKSFCTTAFRISTVVCRKFTCHMRLIAIFVEDRNFRRTDRLATFRTKVVCAQSRRSLLLREFPTSLTLSLSPHP